MLNGDSLHNPIEFKKDWLVWPKTTLTNIEATDCDDTPKGVCFKNISLKECIEKACPQTSCDFGTFIRFSNGKTICSPVRTTNHPLLSPIYRLRREEFYDEFKNSHVQSSVFVNQKAFPFPPDIINTIKMGSIVSLTCENKFLDTTDILSKGKGKLIMNKQNESPLILIPNLKQATPIIKDSLLRFGQSFALGIPKTSFLATPPTIYGSENPMLWVPGLIEPGTQIGVALTILPSKQSKKKLGSLVTFSDTFHLVLSDQAVLAMKEGEKSYIYVSQSPELSFLINQNESLPPNSFLKLKNISFRFLSKMKGFYCNSKNQCKPIQIKNITPKTFHGKWERNPDKKSLVSGIFDNSSVFQNSKCWGLCNEQQVPIANKLPSPPWKNTKKRNFWIILIITIIVIVILIFILFLFRKKIRHEDFHPQVYSSYGSL